MESKQTNKPHKDSEQIDDCQRGGWYIDKTGK